MRPLPGILPLRQILAVPRPFFRIYYPVIVGVVLLQQSRGDVTGNLSSGLLHSLRFHCGFSTGIVHLLSFPESIPSIGIKLIRVEFAIFVQVPPADVLLTMDASHLGETDVIGPASKYGPGR